MHQQRFYGPINLWQQFPRAGYNLYSQILIFQCEVLEVNTEQVCLAVPHHIHSFLKCNLIIIPHLGKWISLLELHVEFKLDAK